MPLDIPNAANAAYGPQAALTTIDIDAIVAAIGGVGVVSGCTVTAQGTPNMTVALASGVVRNGATTVAVNSATLTITAANATNPRFDIVVAHATTGASQVIAGTPVAYVPGTSMPVPPAIPASYVLLASIYVPENAPAIIGAMILPKDVVIGTGVAGPTGQTGAQGPPGTTNGVLMFVGDTSGVSDVSNALSTALNNANSLGQVLRVPPGRYRLNSAIGTKTFPIRLQADPGAVFETYHTTGHTLKCTGSISGTVTNLTVAVAKGDFVLNVGSTTGYAANDYIYVTCPQEIWPDAQSSPDPDDFYHHRGQMVQIRHLGEDIAGTISNTATKITLMEPMHSAMAISGYTANSLANSPVDTLAIRKITFAEQPFIHATFKNMVPSTSVSGFVRLTYCKHIDLKIKGEYATAPGTEIIDCFGGTLDNEHVHYQYDATAGRYAYGDSLIGATCHLTWKTEAKFGYSCGSTNGQQFLFGEPYDIDVYPRCVGSSGAGFTTHAEGKKIRIHDPVMIGCRWSGMHIRSQDTDIDGGEITNCLTGVYGYVYSGDLRIRNLTIRRTYIPTWLVNDPYHGYGIIIDANGGSLSPIRGINISHCTFEDIARSAIRTTGTSPTSDIEIAFNTFRRYNTVNGSTINQINAVSIAEPILDSSIHDNRMLDDQGTPTSGAFVRVPTTQTASEIKVASNDVQSGITVCTNSGNATLTGNY